MLRILYTQYFTKKRIDLTDGIFTDRFTALFADNRHLSVASLLIDRSVGKNDQTARSRLVPKTARKAISDALKDHLASVGGRFYFLYGPNIAALKKGDA